MIVSFPTPDGPDMITSIAPGAPATDAGRSAGDPRRSSDVRSRHRRPAESRSSRSAVEHAFQLVGERRLGADQPAGRWATSSSSRHACRNSRSSPSGAAALARRSGAVHRVARDGMADRLEVDADLVRPAGDEVQLEQRPAGEPLAHAVAGRGRPPVGTTAIRVRCRGSRPIGASIRPTAAATVAVDERQVRLLDPARLELRLSEACAASVRATISSPLVSRSRRWTMPGRWTPAIPRRRQVAAAAEQRVDQGPASWPGDGMDDQARRLVDDQQVVVLVHDVDGDLRLGDRLGRRRRRDVELAAVVPRPTTVLALIGWPSMVSRPSVISRWTWLRDRPRRGPRRQRSARPGRDAHRAEISIAVRAALSCIATGPRASTAARRATGRARCCAATSSRIGEG